MMEINSQNKKNYTDAVQVSLSNAYSCIFCSINKANFLNFIAE
jgi:hypothetical protein